MTDGVSSDAVGVQEARFCWRKFWRNPNSGIMTMNTRANIQGAITEFSALACCANWRDRLIGTLSYQTKNPFRICLILQPSIRRGIDGVVQSYLGSNLRQIGRFIPETDRSGGDGR